MKALLIAILAEVIATTALKASDGFSKWAPSLLVIVGYGAAFYFLSLALKTIPIGTAYAIWSAAGIVLLTFIGWLLYHETPDLTGIIGIAFIIFGVILLQGFSKMGGY